MSNVPTDKVLRAIAQKGFESIADAVEDAGGDMPDVCSVVQLMLVACMLSLAEGDPRRAAEISERVALGTLEQLAGYDKDDTHV